MQRRTLFSFVFSVTCFLGIAGCPRNPDVPVVQNDAGSRVVDADPDVWNWDEPPDAPGGSYRVPDCHRACVRLGELGCPEANRRPGEDSCYVVCRRAQESGKLDLKPACAASAKDKAELLSCKTYRCK